MTRHASDVMTRAPATVEPRTSVAAVARMTREEDIGAVPVTDGERLRGLVGDRDLVVRAMAGGGDPNRTTVANACGADLVAVRPDDEVVRAVEVMREHAVRRVPVVDDSRCAVGIVSIGYLVIERDPESALGDISAARPDT
ncbi:CBS domain-containing protein [Streptomyces incanus]|uniref:CBS domain-containing protein n=1 Tax=Streptomyces incanus TaxID=887453 RepID=A0ABW0XUH1_9ACTN